jgi:hypothetical protein
MSFKGLFVEFSFGYWKVSSWRMTCGFRAISFTDVLNVSTAKTAQLILVLYFEKCGRFCP